MHVRCSDGNRRRTITDAHMNGHIDDVIMTIKHKRELITHSEVERIRRARDI